MAKAYRLDEANELMSRLLKKKYGTISEAARALGMEPKRLFTEITKERKQPKPWDLLDELGLKLEVVIVSDKKGVVIGSELVSEDAIALFMKGFYDCENDVAHETGKGEDYDAGYSRRYAEEQQP